MRRIALLSLSIAWLGFAGASSGALGSHSPEWHRSPAGAKAAANVLSWQSPRGSWPKNRDCSREAYTGDRGKIDGTFDNGATTGELRFLAEAFLATGDARLKESFLLGIDHVLAAQYANGGWPQSHPPGKGYHRHITFNDDTMVRILRLLRDAATAENMAFIDPARRVRAAAAFDRGVDCILRCQVVVGGKPTVWCAQHDVETLAPAGARSYELASLSGSESAGILQLLMSIDKPGPGVIRAVRAGVDWFEHAGIQGIRIVRKDGDRTLVQDPDAPVVWARFYEIDTGKPFYCNRDGVKTFDYNEVDAERRNGYAWLGNWGEAVRKAYAKWPHRAISP